MKPRVSLIAALLVIGASAQAQDVNVEVLQSKLDHPWSLAFLPDNQGMLITLRGGSFSAGSPAKGFPIRWSACRTSGSKDRAVCWMWCWRPILTRAVGCG